MSASSGFAPYSAGGVTPPDDSFFNFTRARFLRNEKEEMSRRHVEFDVDELLSAATAATKAKSCTLIEKLPDGMYNKAFRLTMEDGRQFVAKLPNPNAGLPHLTTASEVATMDFMRTIMKTPVPLVHAWCSDATKTPVKAEYMIMDVARGIQVETLWPKMKFEKKLEFLKDLFRYRSAWASASFGKYGSLYYTERHSVDPAQKTQDCSITVPTQGETELKVTKFDVGPAAGREWVNDGRDSIACDRGPWHNLEDRQRAAGLREEICVRQIDKLPLSPVAIYGPPFYEPTRAKKLKALDYYRQILEYLLPTDGEIGKPSISHGDLHLENIFVNPDDPSQITDFIDWQCTEIEPLFNIAYQPNFLDHDGPSITGMTRPKLPADISKMDPNSARQVRLLNYHQNLEYAWKMLAECQSPVLFRAMMFREQKIPFQALTMPHHLLQEGEAQYPGVLIELEKVWSELPQVVSARSTGKVVRFPIEFSDAERIAIEQDVEASWEGMQLMHDVRGALGELAPGKQGMVRHEYYDEARDALEQLKEQVIASHAKTEEDAAKWRMAWPFNHS